MTLKLLEKGYDEEMNDFNVSSLSQRTNANVVFRWTQQLPFDKIQEIQANCQDAMKLWGYQELKNVKEQNENLCPIFEFNNSTLDATGNVSSRF